MICNELWDPKSIVVVGASNNVEKPGGKVLKNLIDGNYKGKLFCVNPKESIIQGVKSFPSVEDIPIVDLAIIAIAADFIPVSVEILAHKKSTKAFIIISAGFSEEGHKGAELEKRIVETINSVNGTLIGPNCTGVLTTNYQGIFTLPIPKLHPKGCDFITCSGATACFVLESGIRKGLMFSRIVAVGNSAQTGVEEVLEYLDESFDPEKDSKVKILYIENISKPLKLLKHASSLISKGCRIAAIKAGSSEAGSRAASSHTVAMASSDLAVDTLFRKAGIIRCYGREELITVASVLTYSECTGNNFAIITHAGGPGVMLTDSLSKGGLNVPLLNKEIGKELLTKLYPGSSVANPIDFLATGTAEQLGIIMDFVDKRFDEIDAMVVIFGTPGLSKIFDVYDVLDKKIRECKKPVFPVLPSMLTADEESRAFIAKGWAVFPDESLLGQALVKIANTPKPSISESLKICRNRSQIREIIDGASDGYLTPDKTSEFLDAAGINRIKEFVVKTPSELDKALDEISFPIVMKVIGPVHKSDVGGVVLGVKDSGTAHREFKRLLTIKDAVGVLLQPMILGTELFIGVSREPKFGHMILCGLGGIFIEIMKDFSANLTPVSKEEALRGIRSLKSYKVFQGARGKKGIDENVFADLICNLSAALEFAPEIAEIDINPLLASDKTITAVDARINILKKKIS